jgi:hypothetical protein
MNFYKLYNLLNEYGQSLIQTLIEKFKQEQPGLNSTIIRSYIDRFDRIKNNLTEKDITKYSWKDLENAVDGYQPKQRIKAGTLDPTVTDANLLYNQNNVRIYLGKDKKSCVRYGNGYSFCISARGKDNMYGHYRISKRGTPYFIFNDNLPKEDPDHVLVLFVYDIPPDRREYMTRNEKARYTITNALNKGDESYSNLELIVYDYPWIKPITNFVDDDMGDVKAEPLEEIEYRLEDEWSELSSYVLDMGFEFNTLAKMGYLRSWIVMDLFEKSTVQEMKDFLNNDSEIASVFMRYDGYHQSSGGKDHFFLFYKNTGDILKQIKAAASEALEEDFEYKKSDSEYKEKIAKALEFKFKTRAGYLNNFTDEGDVSMYDDGEAANVKFEIESKNYEYFFAKVVNVSNFVRTEENVKKIDNFSKRKIKQNKISNWLKIQSKETLDQILSLYDSHELRPEQLKKHTGIETMTEFVSKFMEMYP